jgi:hypothetical protein
MFNKAIVAQALGTFLKSKKKPYSDLWEMNRQKKTATRTVVVFTKIQANIAEIG